MPPRHLGGPGHAGVRAALEFAAAHPGEARALTIEARGDDAAVDRQDDVIAYFTQLLRDAAPSEKLFPIAADRAMVASIVMIVRSHLVIRLGQAASGAGCGPGLHGPDALCAPAPDRALGVLNLR